MPRGVKAVRDITAEITTAEEKIADYESKIKTLRYQVDTLKKELEQEKLQALNKALSESGLSLDEVLNSLVKQKEDKEQVS